MLSLNRYLPVALVLSMFATTSACAQERAYINPNHASQADVSPFSGAVLTDNTPVYIWYAGLGGWSSAI